MTSIEESSGTDKVSSTKKPDDENSTSEVNDGTNGQLADQEEQGNDKNDQDLIIQNEDDFHEKAVISKLDIYDDEEKDQPRRRSWDRTRGRERKNSREKDREREKERDRDRDRDRDRGRRRTRSQDRGKRSNEQNRRDPNKSSKDIEQDKARAKKDTDTKALAEKEKAIKTLLDSNDVVPPGTEEDVIQIIVDKNQQNEKERRRSRDNRRRSPIRWSRRSPVRRSPIRKSPIRFSPVRRSPLSPERRRRASPGLEFLRTRRSPDRETSLERRRRLRNRRDRDRDRSRSRDRHRSRSLDRRRSRSFDRRGRSRTPDRRRRSSPFDRHSPRRRRSLSRSPLRSPTRRRRSPFINEIARQFSNDPLGRSPADALQGGPQGPLGGMPGMGPGAGGPPYIGPSGAGPPLDPRIMQGGPGLMAGPQGMMPGPRGLLPTPVDMGPVGMHPGGPMMHPGPPQFVGFDSGMSGPFNPPGPDYSAPGVMYGQPAAPPPPSMRPISPQPVPAPPGQMYHPGAPIGPPQQQQPSMGPSHQMSMDTRVGVSQFSPNGRSISPVDGRRSRREERIRTPEPPIISDFKQNEKTSLSSLLEASVSTKDTSNTTPTFKGFKPEVIRQCERALRSLPAEDPRLDMKGRFFFDPNKNLISKDSKEQPTSNSILLRKGRTEIHWEDEFNQMSETSLSPSESKHLEQRRVITHQKICQTEDTITESIGVQTEITRSDFSMQVDPSDLMPPEEDLRNEIATAAAVAPRAAPNYDERRTNNFDDRRNFDDRLGGGGSRPLGDRLDWNMRETFDHGAGSHNPPLRDVEDLRWSLSSNRNSNPAWRSNSGGGGVGGGNIAGGPGAGSGGPAIDNFSSLSSRAIVNDHAHGASGPSGMDLRGMDVMRDRPEPGNRMIDARERLMEQRGIIDYRDRDIDMRGDLRGDLRNDLRNDMRGMDVGNERDIMMDRSIRDERRAPLSGLMDMPRGGGGVGGIGDFGRREPLDDYDLRQRFGDGYGRVGGPIEQLMDRDRIEPPIIRGRESPPPVDDGDDLEIIEERVFDRDAWGRIGSNIGNQFGNSRSGVGGGGMPSAGLRTGNQPPVNRPFRGGRVGGFRPNF